MAWVHGALAVVCLGIGGLHLFRVGRQPRGRALEAAYAVMALGMAGMFSPVGDPVPAPAWTGVFLMCGAWFGVLLARRSLGVLGGEALHLVVGSVAMLFMLAADHQAGGLGIRHRAHEVDAPGLAGAASAVALVLAAYFVLHALRCADRLRVARLGGGPSADRAAGTTSLRTASSASPSTATAPVLAPDACSATLPVLAHLSMTVAMATMLIGMI
jgi:hypothetical protein